MTKFSKQAECIDFDADMAWFNTSQPLNRCLIHIIQGD